MSKAIPDQKKKYPKNVLEPIKDYLLRKQQQLIRRKKSLEAEDPFADKDRINDNAAIDTEAAEQYGHDRVAAIKSESDKALVRIRKALTLIKIGKWGQCEECGKMIDTNRLAIDPTVSLCVICQSKSDKNAVRG